VAELKLLAEPPVVAAAVGVLHGLSAVAELKLDLLRRASGALVAFSTASAPWPN